MLINNFKYKLNSNANAFPNLQIELDNTITPPNTLSKYFSLNNDNVNSLINRQLYASQPESFNDLFDSTFFSLDLSQITTEHILKLIPNSLSNEDVELFKSDKGRFEQKLRQTLFAFWNLRLGIVCMTANQTNQLMWAHYSNNRGFLVEYNYKLFPFNYTGPYPINYVPEIRKINIINTEIDIGMLVNFLLKHEIWSYENEFRFLLFPDSHPTFKTAGRFGYISSQHETQQRLIKYPEACIKKVVLGFNFFNNENIIDKQDIEYTIEFTSKLSDIKINLLHHLIETNTPTELINLNISKFALESKKIKIIKVSNSKYKVVKNSN